MAVATYPGTVSPLRGLDPYGEAERDVWQGREADRDAVAKLVTADGFRAGLLFGEPGSGKTSLLRAGLIPHLRDHGVVALICEDLTQPAASFGAGMSAFGIQPMGGEQPTAFLTRAVGNAVQGQQFVFVIDDVDLLCADERAVMELSDLFSRVISRASGRARFLFACASERLHVLGGLERRTGSLFPPSTRYELTRLPPGEASQLLDRILSFSGVAADPALADAVVQGLGRGGPVLPADLQLAGIAMRDLRISSLAALKQLGGPTELEEAWLHQACQAAGNERAAMRLCAELAEVGPGALPADQLARRAGLEPALAQHAFAVLEQRGVILRGDAGGATWMLRHEVLVARVKDLTAPTRAAARRAFDLLGSKTASKERLTIGELRALRSEGIAPATPAELDVVLRSKRYYLMILGGIAAVPLILLIIIWISLAGRVYLDLTPRPGGETVVVRGGRAGLSGFFWLPGGYGDEIADTGLTRAMVAPEQWKKIDSHDVGASADDWDALLGSIMAPQLARLVDYATTGNEAALAELRKAAKDNPEDLAELLAALRSIARGTPAEVALIESALKLPAPAVQRAAVAAAGAAARRRPDAYTATLTEALISPEPELRRIAFASVRGLGERGRALFQAALAKGPDEAVRRELQLEVAVAAADGGGPSAAGAIAVLSDPEASQALRDRAKTQIRAALAKDPEAAAAALVALVGQDGAPIDARAFAMEVLRERDAAKIPGLLEAVKAAWGSRSAAVRVAALPLYAKADPTTAGGELATMLDDPKLDKALRVAAALAWGEIVPVNKGAATNALDRLIKDPDNEVRAAAATAAGRAGTTYLDRLYKMAKAEAYGVRIGAAQGLAVSAESGASAEYAVGGIWQLWRDKGRARRDAARIFAHVAKKKPAAVMAYLRDAARSTEDPALRPIGVEGLCNASLAGAPSARAALAQSTDDPSADVRLIVMSCVADGPDPAKNGAAIAAKLVRDPNSEIRADAARVLALSAAKGGKVPDAIAGALTALLDDANREVRIIGVRAIGGLGAEAPKPAVMAMTRLFRRADEGEKLTIIRAARQIGGAAEELVALAAGDNSSVRVRIEAVDAALGAKLGTATVLMTALADSDPQVRRAALERLATAKDVDPAAVDRALTLAARDPNPDISQLALTTTARVAAKDAVIARLSRLLQSRAERDRAQAAAAAVGLVDRADRDADKSVKLLDPLLDDPSHDVRVAMMPALAAAYAKTNDAEKLADLLRNSEGNAMRRLVIAAAFVTLARTDAGAKASEATLAKVAKDGPPMARFIAKLTAGLIASKSDGMAFLQELVP
ncbi:MAG TPA: AAA family ATPase [Kofleriaceae bacterium]|nr:AAA family ATPase [Kofleriaceae bacterium]